MQVRPFEESDFEAVLALWHETCRATYTFIPLEQHYDLDSRRGFFRGSILPRCALTIAEADGRPLGFLAMEGDYVDRLYVAVGEQRQGVGEALLAHARAVSPRGLRLHTHVANTGARAFYEKHGFRAVRFGVSPPPESEPDVEYHWTPAVEDRA
jgi:ribosomal protein S18 acetylase RimI-like enzyme